MINYGLSDTSGKMSIYSDKSGSTMASLYKRDLEYRNINFENNEEVDILTLDEFCANQKIDNILLLKIDVEGNEYNVLKGAKRMLEEGRIKYIQFESGGCNISSRIFFFDFWNLLNEKYKIYHIMKDGIDEINNYDERLEIFTYCNYFCKRKE